VVPTRYVWVWGVWGHMEAGGGCVWANHTKTCMQALPITSAQTQLILAAAAEFLEPRALTPPPPPPCLPHPPTHPPTHLVLAAEVGLPPAAIQPLLAHQEGGTLVQGRVLQVRPCRCQGAAAEPGSVGEAHPPGTIPVGDVEEEEAGRRGWEAGQWA
jgi:hypothetical protein